ncbi:MAG: 50S ribosomal protein L3 [Candidatus Micrarchaeia archaeon]
MAKIRSHRHGSLAFRPRKRAAELSPRIKTWPAVGEAVPLAFAGFKAGMTRVALIDDSNSPSKGFEIAVPATVVETPPLLVYGIRAYVRAADGTKRVLSDGLVSDEKLLKPLGLKPNKGMEKIEKAAGELIDVSLLAAVQPGKTGVGRKKPFFVEVGIGGTQEAKLAHAKSLLGKELHARDVFKEGEFVDAIAVSKGKGWQGAVKRFGVHLQRRKATGRRRHVGTLGPWHPAKVMYTAPQAGQTGFHRRTQLNNRILKIGEKGEEIVPNGGFLRYGVVKNPYILLKGSLIGTRKRLILLRKSLRLREAKKPEIKFVSTSSMQGG